MSDVFSKAKRSEVMTLIRARGNMTTEVAFMKLLRIYKISGWRRHMSLTLKQTALRNAYGGKRRPRVKPDFVFPRVRVAVFIDGCFWHGCPLHGTKPSGNEEFWRTKLRDNQARDRYVTKALRRQKWTVFRLWEHQLRQGDRFVAQLGQNIASRNGQRTSNVLKC